MLALSPVSPIQKWTPCRRWAGSSHLHKSTFLPDRALGRRGGGAGQMAQGSPQVGPGGVGWNGGEGGVWGRGPRMKTVGASLTAEPVM